MSCDLEVTNESSRLERKFHQCSMLHRYGDKTPKSVVGRIFSIIWIQLGLVIMAIFMANITSALTVLNLEMGLGSLVGKKVCESLLSIWVNMMIMIS